MMRAFWAALAVILMAFSAGPSLAQASKPVVHKVAIQVNTNDPATMNLALNNIQNIYDFYKQKNEKVDIQLVAYGPGLHMLRADTSPVKDRIATMSLEHSDLGILACGNTQTNMAKQEKKDISLISEAKLVPAGVVKLMELQAQGYAYIRP